MGAVILVLLTMPWFEHPEQGDSFDILWEMVCLAVSLSGLAVRIVTIGFTPGGTSGTNSRRQIADSLNTTGMYSVTRNPLYLGNFIITFGLSLFFRLWWFSTLATLIFWLYYERIIFAEESFLIQTFGDLYLEWAGKTPVFIPDFRLWKPPALTFSMRKVLKNEYKSFFAIVSAFFLLEIIGDAFVEEALVLDGIWVGLLIGSLVFYVIVRYLKKKTRLLDTDGR